MISRTVGDNPRNEYLRSEANRRRDSCVASSPGSGQLHRRRDTVPTSIVPEESSRSSIIIPEESSGSIIPEERASLQPLVPIMTSGESVQSAPLLAHESKRRLLYKTLCFVLLALQGGVLDFYLIAFTDLSWCSWIATDLVVLSGWALFFVKNARSKRERACGFRPRSSAGGGGGLGDFTYAYLAWLFHVIACAPKVALVVETSLLELVAHRAPCGLTGFRVTALLSAPLLLCLVDAVAEDPSGATRHRAHARFLATCLDLLDSFTLLELLLLLPPRSSDIPAAGLRYAAVAAYFAALAAPVVWLHELTAPAAPRCWPWLRVAADLLVDAPLLAVRCVQVYAYGAPAPLFMFKNVFFVAYKLLELPERLAAARRVRRRSGGGAAADPARFSHGVSDNDMCPHGYVNTLTVTQS